MSLDATKGVSNVVRRTWDVEDFARKGAERRTREESGMGDTNDGPIETKLFKKADPNAQGPAGSARAYLQKRDFKVDVDSKVNKKETVNMSDVVQKSGGYFCEVCECLLKDSTSWLRHINGKNHQRKLGFSMRVKKVSVDEVNVKMQELIKSKAKKTDEPVDFKARYEEKIMKREQEMMTEKAAKKEAKLKKKEEKKRMNDAEIKAKAVNEPMGEGIDPAMLAMLGMSGFGGGKP